MGDILHTAYEDAMNETCGVKGWKLLDLPRISPELYEETLNRIGREDVKFIVGSTGDFRIVGGKAEPTPPWVRATLLLSPEGYERLRQSVEAKSEAEANYDPT